MRDDGPHFITRLKVSAQDVALWREKIKIVNDLLML